MKKPAKKIVTKMKRDQEASARRTVFEELFYDFHRNRVQVYKMNFVRGIMFGLGSVIGGTVVIALLVWILAMLGSVIQPLGDVFDSITRLLESGE